MLLGRHDGHPYGCIFVVSHMRSFSTLLCHILGSHSEISGYVETHQSYVGTVELDRLATIVRMATGDRVVRKYILDKILHNQVYIAPSVLSRPNVKVLFLVRNAEDTLRSILNLFHGNDKEPYGDPEQALLYYATRLQRIEEYSVQLGRSALFLEAEKLLDDTPAVLDRLARWLQLGEPLNPSYRTFQYTGVPYYGDTSAHIKTGKVVAAETRHSTYVAMSIPEDVMRRGKEAYATCRETLLSNAEC